MEAKKIVITKEMLINASDYIPLAIKEEWAQKNAVKCFDKLEIKSDDEPMPPMYMVNTMLKNRYLMTAFVSLYMKQEYEEELTDTELMSVSDYDNWAGSHVYNQVERFKPDKSVQNKCFDLLEDWYDFKKLFSAQINSLLLVQNDSVIRQGEYSATQMKELPALLEQLKELQAQQQAEE